MNVTLRPFDFSDTDYAAVADLLNLYFPEHPKTPVEMREEDGRRAEKFKMARFIAETSEGETVGIGRYGQGPWNYKPHKFEVFIATSPDKQNTGIGSALFDHVLKHLAPLGPKKLSCYVRENLTQSVAFATKRGFVEEMRDWESKLDVAAFDFALWKDAAQKATDNGITICSLADLKDDPDRDRKIWQAEMEMSDDVPSSDPFIPLAFDEYHKEVLTDPHHLPEAFFVAVATSGEYVGTSTLWARTTSRDLDTGLTAVKRSHRRKGIALALKLRAIAFAKAYGAEFVRTENATTNEAMLSINVALGFVRQPAWISYGKVL